MTIAYAVYTAALPNRDNYFFSSLLHPEQEVPHAFAALRRSSLEAKTKAPSREAPRRSGALQPERALRVCRYRFGKRTMIRRRVLDRVHTNGSGTA